VQQHFPIGKRKYGALDKIVGGAELTNALAEIEASVERARVRAGGHV
jgi:hypothetical protein